MELSSNIYRNIYMQSFSHDDVPEEPDSPEQRLWKAVLITLHNDIDRSIRNQEPIEGYLTEMNSEWFEIVCDLAGYDAAWVRGKIQRKLLPL